MVVERNGWFATDDIQYCKKIDENNYRFVEAIWLDTCGDDPRAENGKDEDDNYVVCSDWIDLEMYDEEDIECVISSYQYTMESLKEIYGDCMNQIIAECLFEQHSIRDGNCITGVVSMEDAEKEIQAHINRN